MFSCTVTTACEGYHSGARKNLLWGKYTQLCSHGRRWQKEVKAEKMVTFVKSSFKKQ